MSDSLASREREKDYLVLLPPSPFTRVIYPSFFLWLWDHAVGPSRQAVLPLRKVRRACSIIWSIVIDCTWWGFAACTVVWCIYSIYIYAIFKTWRLAGRQAARVSRCWFIIFSITNESLYTPCSHRHKDTCNITRTNAVLLQGRHVLFTLHDALFQNGAVEPIYNYRLYV